MRLSKHCTEPFFSVLVVSILLTPHSPPPVLLPLPLPLPLPSSSIPPSPPFDPLLFCFGSLTLWCTIVLIYRLLIVESRVCLLESGELSCCELVASFLTMAGLALRVAWGGQRKDEGGARGGHGRHGGCRLFIVVITHHGRWVAVGESWTGRC